MQIQWKEAKLRSQSWEDEKDSNKPWCGIFDFATTRRTAIESVKKALSHDVPFALLISKEVEDLWRETARTYDQRRKKSQNLNLNFLENYSSRR